MSPSALSEVVSENTLELFTPSCSPNKVKFVNSILLPLRSGPADSSLSYCALLYPMPPWGTLAFCCYLATMFCSAPGFFSFSPALLASPCLFKAQPHSVSFPDVTTQDQSLLWVLTNTLLPPLSLCSFVMRLGLPHWTVNSFRMGIASPLSLFSTGPNVIDVEAIFNQWCWMTLIPASFCCYF